MKALPLLGRKSEIKPEINTLGGGDMTETLQALQETLVNIQAVKSCRVLGDADDISQIYVEAELKALDEDARTQEIKGIVRSIVGAAAIHHEMELDYRKIKVIEYKPQDEGEEPMHPRIQIVAAYQRRIPKRECVVELHCLKQTYTGAAPVGRSMAESVFDAFLSAFLQMNFGSLQLEYLQMLNNDFSKERLILLKVKHRDPSGDIRSLVGVAEVMEDLPLAVVKAALNAVNRRILVQMNRQHENAST